MDSKNLFLLIALIVFIITTIVSAMPKPQYYDCMFSPSLNGFSTWCGPSKWKNCKFGKSFRWVFFLSANQLKYYHLIVLEIVFILN